MAGSYALEARTGPYNALYERPATLALAGDVNGSAVLDAGCGPGILAEILVERGARVTALDVSTEMARLARRRLGDRAGVLRADLGEPLPLAPASFDLVVASLVLHYLRDWAGPLGELHRVLRPGGRLVASIHHPFAYRHLAVGSYHALELVADEWVKGGTAYSVHFYHRPLGQVVDAVVGAGFALERLAEPRPTPECAERSPETFAALTARPWFLFVVARRRPDGPGPAT